ncbi:MAG: hypothetical protein OK454_11450, partial [Thaumarchaeota archaeon]|nr:hypothetical protein [Nitrososphaerota archaeon]
LDGKADEILPVTKTEKIRNYHGEREIEKPKFETLDATSFGTSAAIQRDRLWVARTNQMKAIQRFADDEYNREHDNILKWYNDALVKNREALLDACARGELNLPAWVTKEGGHFSGKEMKKEAPSLRQEQGTSWSKSHSYYGFHRPYQCLSETVEEQVPSRGWRRQMRTVRYVMCAERTTVKASIFTVIKVTCPEALATLCGVKVEDLPWALQHWYNDHPYHGNSILNRLDPEDWVLHNPWMPEGWRSTGLQLDVGVAHCKLAFAARRKTLGLPPKEWPAKGDE